jgi:hypothetical protein
MVLWFGNASLGSCNCIRHPDPHLDRHTRIVIYTPFSDRNTASMDSKVAAIWRYH